MHYGYDITRNVDIEKYFYFSAQGGQVSYAGSRGQMKLAHPTKTEPSPPLTRGGWGGFMA